MTNIREAIELYIEDCIATPGTLSQILKAADLTVEALLELL
jgi:predicted RNase H-like HicB family nuclease